MSSSSGSPSRDGPSDYEVEIPCGTYRLDFGPNFLSSVLGSEFHTLKMDIKPPSISGDAVFSFDPGDAIKLTIPTEEPDTNAVYKGTVSKVKNGRECLLLFDGENLRIEKVQTAMFAKHVRCDDPDTEELIHTRVDMTKPTLSVLHSNNGGYGKLDYNNGNSSINHSYVHRPVASSIAPSAPPAAHVVTAAGNNNDADDEVSEQSDSDDEEMLLKQMESVDSTSGGHGESSSKMEYSSTCPTSPSKNSALLEDLRMSDDSSCCNSNNSSCSSDSDSDTEEKPKPEPMDYTLSSPAPAIQRVASPVSVRPAGINMNSTFHMLSSDLHLSESSSSEED